MERYRRNLLEKVNNHIRLYGIKVFEKLSDSIKVDKNRDVYYIIRRNGHGAGFFSNYLWVLSHIIYANENGMIPVVDMKYYPTLYSEKECVNGTKNAWNYYFEDVSDVSLHDAYASRNYVLGEFVYRQDLVEKFCEQYGFPTKEAVSYYSPIIDKHIRIRKELMDRIKEDMSSVGADCKMIAVHYRGTDMKRTDLSQHYQPADVDQYIENTRKLVDETGISKIFLATDEEDVINQFKTSFLDRIITYNAFRAENGDDCIGLHDSKVVRDKHKYMLGYEVLRDAYTLSRADALVCGYSNVSNVAIIWNNNQYKKICLVTKDVI